VAVASAGLYASLHLALDRNPRQCPTTQFFTGRMPFLPPSQQRQSTEGKNLEYLQYLAELCQLCSDDRLRSSSHQDYVVPRTYKRLADSSFSVAGPTAWNSLPVEFHRTFTYISFCSRLKTFLFSKFYSQ